MFIGYPIWWGIAAWPIDGFIGANDFTGKTVIPFCTSAASGLGKSCELLKEAAESGKWLYIGNFLDKNISVLKVEDGKLVDSGVKIPLAGAPASMRGPVN